MPVKVMKETGAMLRQLVSVERNPLSFKDFRALIARKPSPFCVSPLRTCTVMKPVNFGDPGLSGCVSDQRKITFN